MIAGKVTLVVPSLDRSYGGPRAKAFSLRRALTQLGITAGLVGVGGDSDEEGVTSIQSLARFRTAPIPRGTSDVVDEIRSADVVHIFGYRDPVGMVAAYAAARLNRPIIWEPCGMAFPGYRSVGMKRVFDRALGVRAFRKTTIMVLTSLVERKHLDPYWDKIPKVIRPNGIDWPRPASTARKPNRFRSSLGIPDGAPLVLSVGRFNHVKGMNYLGRAVVDTPNLWGVMVGPPEDRAIVDELHELMSQSAGRLKVVAAGLWGDQKVEALRSANVFCMPSLYESFGSASAEAAAAGLPVVLGINCGVREFLPHSSVRLVDPRDSHALGSTLLDTATNPSLTHIAAANADDVLHRLNWLKIASEQLRIYGDAIGEPR